ERAVLAMALAYRYKSDPKSAMMETALKLTDGRARTFASRVGACLRLAYNLSGGAPGLLPQIQLRRSDRELRLVRPQTAQGSLGDVHARRLARAAGGCGAQSAIV